MKNHINLINKISEISKTVVNMFTCPNSFGNDKIKKHILANMLERIVLSKIIGNNKTHILLNLHNIELRMHHFNNNKNVYFLPLHNYDIFEFMAIFFTDVLYECQNTKKKLINLRNDGFTTGSNFDPILCRLLKHQYSDVYNFNYVFDYYHIPNAEILQMVLSINGINVSLCCAEKMLYAYNLGKTNYDILSFGINDTPQFCQTKNNMIQCTINDEFYHQIGINGNIFNTDKFIKKLLQNLDEKYNLPI